MMGIPGPELDAQTRERLMHPTVGGVILFTRNYRDRPQLQRLVRDLRAARAGLLVAVDHEGGRVQRFRDGFTVLPPARAYGQLYEQDPSAGEAAARAGGQVLAGELREAGLDFSFAPVLDLDFGRSDVIGDRAFHRDASIVARLAGAFIDGLHDQGMAAVGKHFPGHGWARADSHAILPDDERGLDALLDDDLRPYRTLATALDAVMPAHVRYPAVDRQPAGFSANWLHRILRGRLRFRGAIISDDLDMAGAHGAGKPAARAEAAWFAGCDLLLSCSEMAAVDDILDHASLEKRRDSTARVAALRARTADTQTAVDLAAARQRLATLG